VLCFYIYFESVLRFVVTTAVGTATGAVDSRRLIFGGDSEAALMRSVVDEVDYHPAERLQLIGQIGMHINVDVVRRIGGKTVFRLIQSQSQNGTASAIAHEIDIQGLASGLVALENLVDLPAGSIGNVDHYESLLFRKAAGRNIVTIFGFHVYIKTNIVLFRS